MIRVLGLIPARGGSKGIPRKNIALLGGQPLLAYTAQAALGAKRLTRVVVSTDDEEIAAVARQYGVDVPFLRPAELAQDKTPTLPVVQHALRYLEAAGERFDAVCLLQPTTPFRNPEDIDACADLLVESGADAVVSVMPVPTEYNPMWVFFQTPDGFLNLAMRGSEPISSRQQLPPAYHRDGSIYVTRRDVVLEQNSLYGKRLTGFVSRQDRHVNIDTPADWERAAVLAASGI